MVSFENVGAHVATPRSLPVQVDDKTRTPTAEPPAARPLSRGRRVVHAASRLSLAVVIGLTVASTVPHLLGYDTVRVVSSSMEPAVRTSDVVLTAKSDGQNLTPGTIINFATDTGNVLHRIDEVTADGYRTAGDANNTRDSEIVRPNQISGVAVLVVPMAGVPSLWLERGEYVKFGALVVALVAAAYCSRRQWVYGT